MESEPGDVQPSTCVSESQVREQVDRMLSNRLFQRSDRLSRFLRYIIEESLCGRATELKEQVLAAELYARADSFDPAADPIVRIDARRLRDKLREFYAESPNEPILITLPKGSYAPRYEWNTSTGSLVVASLSQAGQTEASRRPRRLWLPALVLAAGTSLIGIAITSKTSQRENSPVRITPLTSYPGGEYGPALSPDGNFVAFSRTPPGSPGPPDIYVKAVNSEAFHKITDTPVGEYSPSWSPDGKEIAFVRALRNKDMGVFIIPSIGGAERKISETGTLVVWCPDGRSLVIRDRVGDEPNSLFRVDLSTFQRYRLTRPPAGFVDWRFDISPDGKRLAFVRNNHALVGSVYTVGIDGGEAARVTDSCAGSLDVGWMPDGRELIYTCRSEGFNRLWRVPIDRSREPSLLPHGPMPAGEFSIARPGPRQGARIAFVTERSNVNILRRIDLRSAVNGAFSPGTPFSETTRKEWPGAFSPDGSKVVILSDRTTPNPELWIVDSNGGAARQLTAFGGNGARACAWSPDGRKIVVSAVVHNSADLYVVPSDGSSPTRLTTSPTAEGHPEWSRDGHWIYYTAHADGPAPNIWRIPAGGGVSQQVTYDGGFEPKASLDGRHLYYLDKPPPGTGTTQVFARLMRVPVEGGESELIHDGVPPRFWSVTENGVVFLKLVELSAAEQKTRQLDRVRVDAVEMYRFADRKIVRLGTLPYRVIAGSGFIVSRDGRWALAGVDAGSESDLILLDGLR